MPRTKKITSKLMCETISGYLSTLAGVLIGEDTVERMSDTMGLKGFLSLYDKAKEGQKKDQSPKRIK